MCLLSLFIVIRKNSNWIILFGKSHYERSEAIQSSEINKKFLYSFDKFFDMYPLFFLFFSMRLCREKQSCELFFERERITCTPTRKKRGRLLCGVHLLTSFVYTSGLLRKSRVDFSRPKIYWIATLRWRFVRNDRDFFLLSSLWQKKALEWGLYFN